MNPYRRARILLAELSEQEGHGQRAGAVVVGTEGRGAPDDALLHRPQNHLTVIGVSTHVGERDGGIESGQRRLNGYCAGGLRVGIGIAVCGDGDRIADAALYGDPL